MAEHGAQLVHALPRLTYSVAEAAELLGVSRPQMERVLKAGSLRCISLLAGGERRISYPALLRYLEEREAAEL